MKLLVMVLLFPFVAFAARVAALPSPEPVGFADTEAEESEELKV